MPTEFIDASPLVTTSWDDGHPSDLRLADLLEKHGVNGTFYIPCTNSEGRPVMGSTQIALVGRRFEIGGHTQDHVSLTEMAPYLATNQILTNKQWLEDLLGHEVCGFAYVRGHHNRIVRSLVKKAGFQYARTIKNLMSSPGFDRFQLPTTTQFFVHSRSTYVRNYVSGGPSLQRTKMLTSLLIDNPLATRCLRAAQICIGLGGHFHLWGHSWELDEYNLWGELDRFFYQVRELNVRFVSNAAWCASLAMSVPVETRAAADRGSNQTIDHFDRHRQQWTF
jgi:polysaccharide deacetylase